MTMTFTPRLRRLMRASVDIIEESERALEKHGPEQTIDAPGKTNGDRLAILMEEVGEVAKELTYDQQDDTIGFTRLTDVKLGGVLAEMTSIDGKPFIEFRSRKLPVAEMSDADLEMYGWVRHRRTPTDRLRKELVQVGAMAATWIALIDDKEN
jgi:hypothetical protein